MCGRTAQGLAPGQIRQQLERTLPSKPADTWIGEDKYRTSYNVAPTRYQPVVRADSQTKSYVVHMMRWGLIPRSTQSMPEYSSVLKSINARDDSLFMGPTGKPMFNHSKNHKRCILLAEGFYEWRRRGKERVPFYTRRRDGNLMLMAAIYDVAKIKEETEPMYTYATITTNASPQLDWLHDRMPVLIPNNDHDKIRAWLDPNLKWNATLEAMLKPCDESMSPGDGGEPIYALETYQVDEKVNSVRNDSPEFAQPWNSSTNKKTLNRFFFAKAEPSSSESSRHAPTSSTSTPFKHDEHLESKDGVGDFGGPFDYTDDITVVSTSADNSVKDEEEFAQEQVSVAADDFKRGIGFEEQQEQLQQQGQTVLSASGGQDNDDTEDQDLALALELSRQEQANYQSPSSPSTRTTLKRDTTSSPSTRVASASGNILESPARNTTRAMQVISSSLTGSVDLLEKRRQQRKQEEEEMKQILEMSRLEAIADGHEDVGGEDNSQNSTPQLTLSEALPSKNEEHAHGDLERREAEELEKAINASLNGSVTGNSPTSSPSISTQSSPAHPKRPAQPQSPTASPRKRKPAAQSSPSSPAGSSPMKPAKKGKPSQDVKITSFFQHTNSS
ncbi:hypothetical protein BGZ96_006553 [Linnemannia gamsii]|uniref:DUF159-domain-containing protein n=1 Tax=Linnemannia gamsii TaxID=64522 RepID=A0ABQ7K2R8_9FUNG|nr:hypothetical protein BGZ96_006553 [Linnemannia gamsii]